MFNVKVSLRVERWSVKYRGPYGAQWNETIYKKGTWPRTEHSSAVTGQISMKKSYFKSLCSNGAS